MYVDDQAKLRYQLSNYIIDPNRSRFRKVSYPRFCTPVGDRFILTTGCLKDSTDYVVAGKVIELHDEMLKSALYYLSLKTTQEVKTFLKRENTQIFLKKLMGFYIMLAEYLLITI